MEEESLALRDEIVELKSKTVRLEDKIQYLKELLLLKDKNIELLKTNLPKIGTEGNEIVRLKNQIFTLVSKLTEEEEKFHETQKQLHHLQSQNALFSEEILQLKQQLNGMEQKDKRIDQLNKYLKSARNQIRQITPQKELLEEKNRALEQQLLETQAKYGLVNITKAGKVIEKQREYSTENAELRERLIMKEMQINQLRADKDELIEDANYRFEVKKITDEDTSLLIKTLKEDLSKQIDFAKSTLQQLHSSQKEISKSQQEIQDLKDSLRSLHELREDREREISYLQSQISILKEEYSLLKSRMESEAKNHERDVAEIILYKKRLLISNDQLKSLRREMNSKDNYIRIQNEKLEKSLIASSKDNDNNADLLNVSHSSDNNSKSEKKIRSLQIEIQRLHKEIVQLKDAKQAFQNHSVYLANELKKLQREKNMELDIKSETIQRLRNNLKQMKKLYSDVYLKKSLQYQMSGSFSPPPERYRSADKSIDDISSTQDTIDDLTSQLSLLKKHYFRALTTMIKLQLSPTSNSNFDANELYDTLPNKLPVSEWPQWIEDKVKDLLHLSEISHYNNNNCFKMTHRRIISE